MNGQALSRDDISTANQFHGQLPRALGWAFVAFVMWLGGSLLHRATWPNADFLSNGVLFWSFVVMSLTVEPMISTGVIALIAILLSRAGCGRFLAPLLTACLLCGFTGIFDRAAAIALFVPLLIYSESFVDANIGRDDYARGFVATWMTQFCFSVFVIIALFVIRASS